jgi:hypothetical protein
MEMIILWGFCAIAGAVTASRKNRSVSAWFLLSAIFGVFAVIVLAVLPKLVYGDQLQRHLAQLRASK